MDGFLNPDNDKEGGNESEDMRQEREFRSDQSLPISFGVVDEEEQKAVPPPPTSFAINNNEAETGNEQDTVVSADGQAESGEEANMEEIDTVNGETNDGDDQATEDGLLNTADSVSTAETTTTMNSDLEIAQDETVQQQQQQQQQQQDNNDDDEQSTGGIDVNNDVVEVQSDQEEISIDELFEDIDDGVDELIIDSDDNSTNGLDPTNDMDNGVQEQDMESGLVMPSPQDNDAASLSAQDGKLVQASSSSPAASAGELFRDPTPETISSNPYLKVVSGLAPSDLISKFTSTAHPRVQTAVRTTILGLIGTLPKMAFDTTTITTGARLASLMFQMQMTGYMFKNAEYRLSVAQMSSMSVLDSIGEGVGSGSDDDDDRLLLTGENGLDIGGGGSGDGSDSDKEAAEKPKRKSRLSGKIRGKLKLRLRRKKDKDDGNNDNDDDETTNSDKDKVVDTESSNDDDDDTAADDVPEEGIEMEVDADAYMSEIRQEVSSLRKSLALKKQEKEDQIREDLLYFIRTLPEKELRSLTSTMSEDVLVAMKGLVNVVMSGIGEGQVGPETLTEQSGEAMAQLCMWQLVVGYTLRELEVREEMKNSLVSVKYEPDDGAVVMEPGAFE